MTIYAGETVQIFVEATDFDSSTVLSADDVGSVLVTVYDSEDVVAMPESPAVYNAERAGWELNWDTTAVDSGSYEARIEAHGVGPNPAVAIEFKKLRLKQQRVGGPA